MKPTVKMTIAALAVASSLAVSPAMAQTTGSTTTATTPPPATTGTAATNLSNSFSGWAGSPENSTALVNGLRTGQPITLSSAPTAPGSAATTTTFTPPTKPMGYGNVRIALSLAQQQLASQGITQPTPQQLQTALTGGSITTTNGVTAQTTNYQGVLQMRASGMGWGKIANTLGYKLGAVMSGRAPATPTTGSGITTAAGTSGTGGSAKTTQHGHASGSGIVTAAGSAGGGVSTGMGATHAHGDAGAGIVTANGGGGGQSHAGGQGKSGK